MEFDRDKVIACMFDPVTSSILAELENGQKECSFLAKENHISEDEVSERLSYLIECGLIQSISENGNLSFIPNDKKLNAIIESENFDTAINGLEKMDSYLN